MADKLDYFTRVYPPADVPLVDGAPPVVAEPAVRQQSSPRVLYVIGIVVCIVILVRSVREVAVNIHQLEAMIGIGLAIWCWALILGGIAFWRSRR